MGILVVALGAAVGSAYFLNQTRPVFFNVRMLNDIMGLPVLGPVSAAWADRNSARERTQTLVFSGAGALLLVVFAAALAWRESAVRLADHVFR